MNTAQDPTETKPAMSDHVTIQLFYDASLLAPAPNETSPTLLVWTSFEGAKQLKAYPIKHVDKRTRSERITVKMPLPPPGKERADDAVWFEAYAETANERGQQVSNRVGSAVIFMYELLDMTEPAELSLAYFNFWNQDGSRRVKGSLLLEKASTGRYNKPDAATDPFLFLPAQNTFLQSTMENAIRMSVWPFTDMAAAAGEAIDPFSENNRRVHAPAWNSPTGWKPGYTYFVTPGRRAPVVTEQTEDYFVSLIRAILARHNTSEAEFRRVVDTQLAQTDDTYDDRFTECCDIVGEALCAASVSLPYIGDSVDTAARITAGKNGMMSGREPSKHGVESFDWAQYRGGGDCEDFARMIHAYRCALQDGEWSSGLLLSAQGLLNCYVGVGILSSVLGAKVSDEVVRNKPFIVGTKRDDDVSIGAHMYYQLIPENKFLAMVKRINRDVDLARMRNPEAPVGSWTEKMPHLVLEGTGMLRTLQRPLISYVTNGGLKAKEKILEREKGFDLLDAYFNRRAVGTFRGHREPIGRLAQRVRRQRQHTRVPNARVGFFYRDATHAFTDDFLRRGYCVAEFTWVTIDEPDLVPETADEMYSDDPMLSPAKKTVAIGQPARGAELTEWDKAAADFDLETSSDDDDVDDDDDTKAQGASKLAGLVPLKEPIKESHWRKPSNHVEALLGHTKRQNKTGSDRFDRFDYDSDKPQKIAYGAPLTSTLEDRPMRNHVGLLAGPPIDGVSAAVLATHFRHSKPVPLAGANEHAAQIEAAKRESRIANGEDVAGLERVEKKEIDELLFGLSEYANTTWTVDEDLYVYNMFFDAKMFRTPGVGQFILSAVGTASQDSVVQRARVLQEEFLPGHKRLVLQLLCDANSLN